MKIQINGKAFEAENNQTILDVAKQNKIEIPTLCFLKECNNTGKCGICRVEVEGSADLVGACGTYVEEGMKIRTNSRRVQTAVKTRVEELLRDHNFQCGQCSRKDNCEFLKLIHVTKSKLPSEVVQDQRSKRNGEYKEKLDERSSSIVRDASKCIKCGRCVAACNEKSGTAIMQDNNGVMGPKDLKCFDETGCILCGQCVLACPVGALTEKSHIKKVKEAIANPDLHVIVGMAPSIRTSLGEAFKMDYGTDVTGKLYAALRLLGFEKVFDVNFAADMTIMEEGTELIERIKNNGPFPMYTSCCPGWIRLVENYYPNLLENISSAKSPQQMFGATTKTYYSKLTGIPAEKIFTVTIMPCTAKKFEADREEMVNADNNRDVDAVLETRELIKLIKDSGIYFDKLKEEEVDKELGYYTGAATIFGATGGVMEAALRTAKDLVENVSLENVEYKAVRGLEGIKEATVKIGGNDYEVAVIHGAANLFKFMESDLAKEKKYHFIEVMSCPGGCVNGGGQPHLTAKQREEVNIAKERAKVLYNQDAKLQYRKSHSNPFILDMYDKYMGEIGGEKAHQTLHVHYKHNHEEVK